MEQIGEQIKQFFTFNNNNKKTYSDKIVRMSELNTSQDSSRILYSCDKKISEINESKIITYSTPIKSKSKSELSSLSPAENVSPIKRELIDPEAIPSYEEQMNLLDFQTFLKDLTQHHANKTQILSEEPKITYEANKSKETIIFDTRTSPDDEMTLVKIRIAMPRSGNVRVNIINDDNKKQCEVVPRTRRYTQPRMGSKALLFKHDPATDSQIIHDLVTSRFGESLLRNYKRSSLRHQAKYGKHIYANDGVQSTLPDLVQSSNEDDVYNTAMETFAPSVVANTTITLDDSSDIKYPSDEEFKALFDKTSSISASIGTSNVSTLLTTDLDDESRINFYENEAAPISGVVNPEDRLQYLIGESNKYCQMAGQASKALTLCKKTKEFCGSAEEIEAERLLLLATRKLEAAKSEIENHHHGYYDVKKGCGNVKLANLSFTLQNYGSSNKKKETYTHWYVCIISLGDHIYATEAQQADSYNTVQFVDEFQFNRLDAGFEVNLNVYSLRVRNNTKNFSHEHKFHLNKSLKNLWLQKLFHHRKITKYDDDFDVQSSSFTLDAKFTFNLSHLHQVSNFKFTYLSLCSLLNDHFDAQFETSVTLNEDYCGFLNIGLETNGGNITWNRRWCVIDGTKLYLYNYPNEQSPFTQIDLSQAGCDVSHAARAICAKPRTLLLDVCDRRYFLAADSKQTMNLWERKLNVVINALRQWHISSNNI